MHFCELAARTSLARGELGSTRPWNTGLNWFIPALMKRRVGSSSGTTGDAGTAVWPRRSKKSTKV